MHNAAQLSTRSGAKIDNTGTICALNVCSHMEVRAMGL